MRRLLAVAVALLALSVVPVHAETVVIGDDPGGTFGPYLQKYLDIAYSGDTLRLEGKCESACTLFLGIVPRARVCVSQGATLGFHSASMGADGAFTLPGTRFMWNDYPRQVRAMLRKRGWNGRVPHPSMMLLTDREMRRLFKACS